MKSMKHYSPLFLGLALAMVIMSACSQSSGNTPSNLTPLAMIQNSANTMKSLKTVHNDLHMTMQTTGMSTNNMDMTLNGSGDESISGKMQKMDFTANLGSVSASFSEIVTNNTAYIQVGQVQWYSIDKTTFEQSSGNLGSLFSGATIDQSSLLGIIENVKITDHGDEDLKGQSLRHITANMDKTALEQLVAANPQLKGEFGSQDLSTTLNNVKNFNASIDVYIDESQFYVHRTELKVNFDGSTDGKTVGTNLDLTVDLSKFNAAVTISAPANATPMTNPHQLFGSLSGL
jgi:hypothetical protein